jgi:hypothetical protein
MSETLVFDEALASSFRRRPESRIFAILWTPAFAGVTAWVDEDLLTQQY